MLGMNLLAGEAQSGQLAVKMTTILRPQPKRQHDSAFPLRFAPKRFSRSIESVVLTSEQRYILTDINESLNPSTRLWYVNCGLP